MDGSPIEVPITAHPESHENETTFVLQPRCSSHGPVAQSVQPEGDTSEGLDLYAPSVDKGLMD